MIAPILAFAGVAAVQAGPLYQRQVSSAVSSAASDALSSVVGAPSSIASEASSAVVSATSAASSAVGSASSAASSGIGSASSMASSMMSSAASSAAITAAPSNATTGNQSYPLYPCPTGFLLTYVQLNQTVPVAVTQVTQSFGSWANSSYFPNVTTSMGGNDVGAMHTINLQGVDLTEQLVNATTNSTSGYAMWTWNLTNGPVSAMGVRISNYSTVLSIYDPTFDQTGTIGNETTLLTYTNFCANSQAEGMQLVSALAGLELGTFASTLGGSAAGGASSMASSMMPSSTMSMSSMASSMASSAASSATEATSSVVSGASSAASAVSSGAVGVTSSIAQGVSSAVSAALPSSSA